MPPLPHRQRLDSRLVDLPHGGRRPSGPAPQGRTMIDDEAEVRDLESQMDLAMEGVRKVVLRLLQDGEVHSQLVVLAVARVAGELGAGIAQAGDVDLETILADVNEVVRKAGRSHHKLLRAAELPVAGNA